MTQFTMTKEYDPVYNDQRIWPNLLWPENMTQFTVTREYDPVYCDQRIWPSLTIKNLLKICSFLYQWQLYYNETYK